MSYPIKEKGKINRNNHKGSIDTLEQLLMDEVHNHINKKSK